MTIRGLPQGSAGMKIAEKFGRPIFTFVDTPGAYPGLSAEEHGQAEAIARNLREMARLQIPSSHNFREVAAVARWPSRWPTVC